MIKKFKQWIISILDYFRFKKSYAQDGEDVVLAAFFEEQKAYRGFFVDVGAHHPVRFSNTQAFYKKGWKGINIDPTPGSMAPFRIWRRRDINLEIGVGAEKSVLTFYCFNEPALNTFDPMVAKERNTGKPYKVVREVAVEILPLGEILDRHLPKGLEIDFLSIDVEGLDLEVIKSNNWAVYKPKFVLVEDHAFQAEDPKKSEIYLFLSSKGYAISAVLKRTIVYKKVKN